MVTRERVIVAVLFCVGIVVFLALLFGLDAWSCYSQWTRSGFPISYGPVQGCVIQTPDGRWIPSKNYRDMS